MKKVLAAAVFVPGLFAASFAFADTVQGKVTAIQDDVLVVSRMSEGGQVEDVSVMVSKDLKLADGRPVSDLKPGENVSVVSENAMFLGLPKARSVEIAGATEKTQDVDWTVNGNASDSSTAETTPEEGSERKAWN